MPISVTVTLLSGIQATVLMHEDETVADLRQKAQAALQRPLGKFIGTSGTLSSTSGTLVEAGVRDGDTITAIQQTVAVAATRSAFALIRAEGTVMTWGCPRDGGDSSAVQHQLYDVQQIQASDSAFAALRGDGKVVAWGNLTPENLFYDPPFSSDSNDDEPRGDVRFESVQSQLRDVKQIQACEEGFAAIKADGTVVTWGSEISGGNSSTVRNSLRNVCCIAAAGRAFAALRRDGSVVTWGEHALGGCSADVQSKLRDVLHIKGSKNGFGAVTASGHVVFWGFSDRVLTEDEFEGDRVTGTFDTKLQEVQQLQLFENSCAAVDKDGHVAILGPCGNLRKSRSLSGLECQQLGEVSCIQASGIFHFGSFAALRKDGTVVTWGFGPSGGDSTAVKHQLTNVVQIQASYRAFAALRSDGTVVSWGDKKASDTSSVQSQLHGVKAIQASHAAFAALREDGSVVAWGLKNFGGCTGAAQGQLKDVICIQANEAAFAAIRADGSVVTWGRRNFGGDSQEVSKELGRSTADAKIFSQALAEATAAAEAKAKMAKARAKARDKDKAKAKAKAKNKTRRKAKTTADTKQVLRLRKRPAAKRLAAKRPAAKRPAAK